MSVPDKYESAEEMFGIDFVQVVEEAVQVYLDDAEEMYDTEQYNNVERILKDFVLYTKEAHSD